ncbi:hypothetical protein [Fictibacillus fluitans]|uniref:Uncharacterized protein n=1 Tax=Fictibacillus fluitans TaxID=3058422 RepID=A0ABT8HUC2_9BACL|nr:hypothetical protein [Fictibacillus sp. NE201]MDN4524329.1 hypothetical protein [Fictibacillus sp. NE201]
MAKKPAKKTAKKTSKYDQAVNKYAHTVKMVTSSTCISCKTQCARGLAYIEKMNCPGAVGHGVPCHLTKGKGTK